MWDLQPHAMAQVQEFLGCITQDWSSNVQLRAQYSRLEQGALG
jgi:hypothetical protein